jgi:ABC-type multidrug transport system ATPase subunit
MSLLTASSHRLSTIMNADHILVVMNGEIIEKGTHDDLLHSGGKYHDLWSKQIFVKPSPATDRSRSSSPKKRNANIVNDLTPQRHTHELAKVLKTAPHGDDSGQTSCGNEDVGKTETSGHKREVSSSSE